MKISQPGVFQIDDCAFFYGGYLSNFYPSTFIINNVTYWCSEQWMMAEKARLFNDDIMLRNILYKKSDPLKIKQYGREVKNFDKDMWAEVARDRVFEGLKEKFKQNPNLAKMLLETDNLLLVEASPTDKIWGIGVGLNDKALSSDRSTWKGTNWLGEVLMKVRNHLKDEKEQKDDALTDDERADYERLKSEREAFQNKTQVLTCAFCGEQYPPDTPPSNNAALVQHIKKCTKHPMNHAFTVLENLVDIISKYQHHIPNSGFPHSDNLLLQMTMAEARLILDE